MIPIQSDGHLSTSVFMPGLVQSPKVCSSGCFALQQYRSVSTHMLRSHVQIIAVCQSVTAIRAPSLSHSWCVKEFPFFLGIQALLQSCGQQFKRPPRPDTPLTSNLLPNDHLLRFLVSSDSNRSEWDNLKSPESSEQHGTTKTKRSEVWPFSHIRI